MIQQSISKCCKAPVKSIDHPLISKRPLYICHNCQTECDLYVYKLEDFKVEMCRYCKEQPTQIHGLCEKCCPCCEENEV